MRALLARPPRNQGVRQDSCEERGRAAGAGLHPEEAGGDPSRLGRKELIRCPGVRLSHSRIQTADTENLEGKSAVAE